MLFRPPKSTLSRKRFLAAGRYKMSSKSVLHHRLTPSTIACLLLLHSLAELHRFAQMWFQDNPFTCSDHNILEERHLIQTRSCLRLSTPTAILCGKET